MNNVGVQPNLREIPTMDNTPVSWDISQRVGVESNQGIRYNGLKECEWVKQYIRDGVVTIADRMAKEFPRLDNQISMGDGCAKLGDCPGHPTGTHMGYKTGRTTFDPNYFTMVAYDPENGLYGNDTQYTPGEYNHPGKRTNIWLDSDKDNMVLNEQIFDWERTFCFLKYMVERFPRFHCTLHEKISDCIKRNIINELWIPIVPHVSQDSGHNNKHHTHMHCNCESQNHK